jgi:hypothetical protein
MSEEEKLLKDAKKLPWEDRLLHKNWKVRNEANIDLASVCDSITDPKDSRLRDFGLFLSLSFSIFFRVSVPTLQICVSLFPMVDLCVSLLLCVMA